MLQQTVATVTFLPGGKQVIIEPGLTIAEAAQRAHLYLSLPCGGKGICGNCRVQVVSGDLGAPTPAEVRLLSPDELADGVRLACQAILTGPAVIEAQHLPQVAGQKDLRGLQLREVPLDPNVKRYALRLERPSLEDQRSDFRRLSDAMSARCLELTALPDALRALPEALREGDYQVSATVVGCRLAEVLPSPVTTPCLGVALDIGTSTVVAYLVDLETGEPLSTAADHNPQIRHGADVISRIEFANNDPEGLATLREEITATINELCHAAADKAGADPRCIYEATVVGNTCMHHLFLGLDPRHLAEAPYVPVTSEPVTARPSELGLDIHPRGSVHCFPCVAGFIGADTVGVIVAEQMTRRPHPVLAVDIGTNGEVALWSGEKLFVASCAAGPAFEGAHIERGMRAAPGAIDRVVLSDGDLSVTTIGGAEAVGICGSGLFDAMAAALESGAVQPTGRLVTEEGAASLAPALRARLLGEGNDRRLLLAGENHNSRGGVYLSQKDIREIQLAKGAVRATVEMMLEYAGLTIDDLGELLLAGAFGNYLQPASALRIGLLPPMPLDLIRGVGNAAGAGAVLALLSRQERDYAAQVAREAHHLELFREREFQSRFAETMIF